MNFQGISSHNGQRVTPENNGIHFQELVSIPQGMRSSTAVKSDFFMRMAIALAGILGVMFHFITSFQIPCVALDLGALCFAEVVVFSFLLEYRKKGKYILLILFGLVAALIVYRFPLLTDGFKLVVDSVYMQVETVKVGLFASGYIPNAEEAIAAFLSFCSFFLAFFICFSVVFRNSFLLLLLTTVPVFEIGMYHGMVPAYWSYALLLSCWIAGLVMSLSKHTGRKTGQPLLGAIGLITAVVLFVSFWVSDYAIENLGVERLPAIDRLRTKISQGIQNFSLEDYLLKVSQNQTKGAPLGKTDVRRYDNVPVLRVNMPSSTSTVYLRGYVGTVYEGDRWNQLSSSDYARHQAMLDEFERAGVYPQNLATNLIGLCKQNGIQHLALPYYAIYVENIGADARYLYTPYHTVYPVNSNLDYFYDTNVFVKKIDHYGLNYYQNFSEPQIFDRLNGYDLTGSDIFLEQNSLERQYRDFVYEEYTKLPERSLQTVKETYGAPAFQAQSLAEKLLIIRQDLSALEYTLSPGKTPYGKDFVEYFLYENQKGYCTYFASAAGVMLRAAGVPTRYVEGFTVKPEDFSDANLAPQEKWLDDFPTYDIELQDNRAHAWIEIYIDGMGWQPFDVTPGGNGSQGMVLPESSMTSDTNSQPVTTSPAMPETSTAAVPSETTTTAAETTPPVTTEPDNPEELIQKQGGKTSVLIRILLTVLVAVAVLALAAYWLIQRRKKAALNRIQEFHQEDYRAAILAIYRYFEKLALWLQVTRPEIPQYEEYVEQVAQRCSGFEFDRNTALKLLNLAEKADFSPHAVQKDEAEAAEKFVQNFASQLYQNNSWPRRILMAYIKRLI